MPKKGIFIIGAVLVVAVIAVLGYIFFFSANRGGPQMLYFNSAT